MRTPIGVSSLARSFRERDRFDSSGNYRDVVDTGDAGAANLFPVPHNLAHRKLLIYY